MQHENRGSANSLRVAFDRNGVRQARQQVCEDDAVLVYLPQSVKRSDDLPGSSADPHTVERAAHSYSAA